MAEKVAATPTKAMTGQSARADLSRKVALTTRVSEEVRNSYKALAAELSMTTGQLQDVALQSFAGKLKNRFFFPIEIENLSYTNKSSSPEAADAARLPMGKTETIDAFAARMGMTVAQLEDAAELWKATHSEVAVRRATARAKAKRRLKWDKDPLPDENPATFAWRAYQAEARAGTLHRGLIGQEDKPLARKLANWLRTHAMPEGIDIPTLPEWNTRQLAKQEGGEAEVVRLYGVARRRKQKLPAAAAG